MAASARPACAPEPASRAPRHRPTPSTPRYSAARIMASSSASATGLPSVWTTTQMPLIGAGRRSWGTRGRPPVRAVPAGSRPEYRWGGAPHREGNLTYTRIMTIKRLDHVSVVVDDLAAAVAFFTALGMTTEGEATVEGQWVDRVNGIDGVRVDIVMMRTPDGHGRLELTKFRHPDVIEVHPAVAPPNAPGLRSVMFAVDSVDATIDR